MNKIIIILLLILGLIILSSCSNALSNKPEICKIQQPSKDKCEGIYYGAEFNKNEGKCEFVSWGCRNPPFVADDNCSDFDDCKNSALMKCQNICE
jgi:hypothetical protein